MILERIHSPYKRNEILRILQQGNASHNERKYLVHFLRYVGYTDREIAMIIHRLNWWEDYSPRETARQIRSLKTRLGEKREKKGENLDETRATAGRQHTPKPPHHHGVRDRWWTECHLRYV